MKKLIIFSFGLNCLLISCEQSKKLPPGWIDEQRLLKADEEPGNWMSLGRNYMQQHHSPLKQINAENVKDLGFAWQYETNSNRGRVYRGLEATPIVVDGVLYTAGAWSQVYADRTRLLGVGPPCFHHTLTLCRCRRGRRR